MFRAVLTAALIQTAGLGSQPTTQDQDRPEAVVEEIIVEGRRQSLSTMIEAFVDEVTEPPRGRGPARWHRAVCVGAVGLRREPAQILVDRVSDIAAQVGLEPGEPGCQPNILIIATDDAAALTSDLVRSRPLAFRPGYAGASQSKAALEEFRLSERPVRWWHVIVPVVRDTNQIAVPPPGEKAPLIPGAGRLRSEITNRLLRTFVIVDVSRIENATFQALGDYIGMIALAQIDPDAELTGYQTVLNMFDRPDGSPSLTRWDSDYLEALYRSELRQRNPNAQLGEVGSVMLREQRASDPSPTEAE